MGIFQTLRGLLTTPELPPEFEGGSQINDIRFTSDGAKYAFLSGGKWVVSSVPEDGVIEINGTRIEIERSGGQFSVRSFSASNSVVIGNIQIGFGASRKLENVDEVYEGVESVDIRSRDGNVRLTASADERVRVAGRMEAKPEKSGGALDVATVDEELRVSIPAELDLGLSVSATDGCIIGRAPFGGKFTAREGQVELAINLAHDSTVATQDGFITLNARGANALTVVSRNGDVKIEGAASGKIKIETLDGDVTSTAEQCSLLEVQTRDGEINVQSRAGAPVTLCSLDGDIKLESKSNGAVGITSRDGEIEAQVDAAGAVEMRTQDGDINLSACSGASVSVVTRGGSVESQIDCPGAVSVRSQDGAITATIIRASSGEIVSRDGDIEIVLKWPLAVEVSTRDGDIDVDNMRTSGRNRFLPPDALEVSGTLRIRAQDGDVTVRYEAE